MALNRDCYPILEIDEDCKHIVCNNNGARSIFKLEHFNRTTKKVLEGVFTDIAKEIRRSPLSEKAEALRLKFLSTFQFVYCQPNMKATLIKRSLQTFDRREYRLHTIVSIYPDGTILSKAPIYRPDGWIIGWEDTSFSLGEITDKAGFEHLKSIVDRIERIRKACYPDTARERTASLLDEFLEDFQYVGVRGGEVKLILRD